MQATKYTFNYLPSQPGRGRTGGICPFAQKRLTGMTVRFAVWCIANEQINQHAGDLGMT